MREHLSSTQISIILKKLLETNDLEGIRRLADLLDKNNFQSYEDEQKNRVKDILNHFGIKNHLMGNNYLTDIIFDNLENSTCIYENLTNVYDKIGNKYQKTGASVERTIRHAIESAFDDMEHDFKFEHFGNLISSKSGKVTNQVFIYVVTNFITNMKKNKNSVRVKK